MPVCTALIADDLWSCGCSPLSITLGLGSESAHLIFSSDFKKMSPLFAQIKDAVALCELFNWLEKEVGS